MAVIKVPKTPKKAFDKHRRASALLLGQIAHLEWAALPASQRKPHQLPKRKVKTEGQAAERVAQLTRMVLTVPAPAAGGAPVVAPVTLPPLPPLPAKPRAKPPKKTGPARKRNAKPARKAARSASRRRTRR